MTAEPKPPTDWEAIEREYRAGQLSVREIGNQFGVSHTAINKRAKAHGWTKNLAAKVKAAVAEKLVSDAVSSGNAREIVEAASERAHNVIKLHRRGIDQLKAQAAILAERLAMHLDGTSAENLPGIGDRESASDMLEKLTRTFGKLVQLERQAYSLDSKPDADPASNGDGGPERTDRDRAKAMAALVAASRKPTT